MAIDAREMIFKECGRGISDKYAHYAAHALCGLLSGNDMYQREEVRQLLVDQAFSIAHEMVLHELFLEHLASQKDFKLSEIK